MKYQLTKLFIFTLFPLISFSQTDITDIDAAYRSAPDDVNRYTDGDDNYSFAVGSNGDDNLLFEDFFIPDPNSSGSLYFAINSLADTIKLRRVDNKAQQVKDILYSLKKKVIPVMEVE